MKNSTSKFVQEVKARQLIDGKTFDPLAIEEKAKASVFNHLKGLGLSLYNADQTVKELQEKYNDAVYTTDNIHNPKGYIEAIRLAKFNLETAKSELESIKEQTNFFMEIQNKFE